MSRFFIALDPKVHEAVKELFTEQCPVVYQGVEYLRIQTLRYTNTGKSTKVSVELLDKNKNAIAVARAEKVVEENPDIIKEDKEKEY